jgi:hypothetical protein
MIGCASGANCPHDVIGARWAPIALRHFCRVVFVQAYTTRFFAAVDLLPMLETSQRQGRYREVTHRAASAYRLLIIGQVDYLPIAVSRRRRLALCARGGAMIIAISVARLLDCRWPH